LALSTRRRALAEATELASVLEAAGERRARRPRELGRAVGRETRAAIAVVDGDAIRLPGACARPRTRVDLLAARLRAASANILAPSDERVANRERARLGRVCTCGDLPGRHARDGHGDWGLRDRDRTAGLNDRLALLDERLAGDGDCKGRSRRHLHLAGDRDELGLRHRCCEVNADGAEVKVGALHVARSASEGDGRSGD